MPIKLCSLMAMRGEWMSKYDIESRYRESYPVTLIDLCREIQAEEEASDVNTEKYSESAEHSKYEADYLRNKFKNSDKSGSIDKLKSKKGFDIEKIAGEDKVQQYDMLRLLKILYYIEKKSCTNLDNSCNFSNFAYGIESRHS